VSVVYIIEISEAQSEVFLSHGSPRLLHSSMRRTCMFALHAPLTLGGGRRNMEPWQQA